jgi:type II secretory pathway predicted ATPase ExeA
MPRYYQHFGLQRDPFLDTSDPQFFLELPAVRRNMRRVLSGVDESRGLTVVIGPPGSGKTSLSSSVEQALLENRSVVIGKILAPTFGNDVEFLLAITRVFGLDCKSRSSAELKNAFKNFLFDTALIEKRALVLLIDKAQNLGADGLATLRLLLNFQVPQKKLLNLILFGEEELAQLIAEYTHFSDCVDTYVRLEVLDAVASTALSRTPAREGRKVARGRGIRAQCAVEAGGGLPQRLANVVRSAMIEAADRGAVVVRMDHLVAVLRARGEKTTRPKAIAARSICADLSMQEPMHVVHRTFFARFLAWFP